MPSLHVIFDENDKIMGLSPADAARVGAQAASIRLETIPDEGPKFRALATKLVDLLMQEMMVHHKFFIAGGGT